MRSNINYSALFEDYLNDIKPGHTQQLVKCVFHSDSNPSLSINTAKGLFKCFGCGASGNHWEFLKLVEPEAQIKILMEKYNE